MASEEDKQQEAGGHGEEEEQYENAQGEEEGGGGEEEEQQQEEEQEEETTPEKRGEPSEEEEQQQPSILGGAFRGLASLASPPDVISNQPWREQPWQSSVAATQGMAAYAAQPLQWLQYLTLTLPFAGGKQAAKTTGAAFSNANSLAEAGSNLGRRAISGWMWSIHKSADLSYDWLLAGLLRCNHWMDGLIANTPPLLKTSLAAQYQPPEEGGQLDRAARESAAQVSGVIAGLSKGAGAPAAARTAERAADHAEHLAAAAGGEKAPAGPEEKQQQQKQKRPPAAAEEPSEAAGEQQQLDLAQQADKALHQVFGSRPPGAGAAEEAQKQREGGGGGGAASWQQWMQKWQADPLAQQSRLLAWHAWMLVRLQLTALAIVRRIAQGLAAWLFKAWVQLSLAVALFAGLLTVGFNGALAAAASFFVSVALRRTRGVKMYTARVRHLSGRATLKVLDTVEAALGLSGLQAPPSLRQKAAPREAAGAKGGRQQQREHGGGGEIQPAEAEGPSPPAAGPIWSREGLAHRLHSLLRGSRGLVEGWVMPDEGVLSRQAEVAAEAALDEDTRAVLHDAEAAADKASTLAAVSLITLGDALRTQAIEVSRLLRLPISPNKWFLASPQHLAQDAAMGAFAQLAGQGPATVLRGMMQMRSGGAGGAGGQQRAAAGVPPGGSSAAQ